MSKKPAGGAAAANPSDLPEILAADVLRAETGCFPPLLDKEAELCPKLHSILAPMMVNDPNHRGKGDPRKVLREPLLMISWDRAAGLWKWSLTDKVLNVGWDGPLPSLVGIAEAVETCLVAGTYRVKKKKVT